MAIGAKQAEPIFVLPQKYLAPCSQPPLGPTRGVRFLRFLPLSFPDNPVSGRYDPRCKTGLYLNIGPGNAQCPRARRLSPGPTKPHRNVFWQQGGHLFPASRMSCKEAVPYHSVSGCHRCHRCHRLFAVCLTPPFSWQRSAAIRIASHAALRRCARAFGVPMGQ